MKNAEIIQQLNLEQKCALLSGETVFTTRGYKKAGIPSITLSDGPNGVRKQAGAADHLGLNPSVPATCFPTAATVACSWDPALGEQVGQAMGEEAAAQEVSVLLGPGLNTKRSPLCGRNFEYFSEDPYLSGKMAAGYVRGIQSEGISACPKHFAVNSQELRRMASDSVVDERSLRELYLTGFEIVVKEAHPKTIMSSYNLINGTYANENAHLLQDILQQMGVLVGVGAVDEVVAGHNGFGMCLFDNNLKAGQVQLAQAALVHHGVGRHTAQLLAVDGEMLGAGGDTLGLDAAHIACGHLAGEVGILGEILKVAAAKRAALGV